MALIPNGLGYFLGCLDRIFIKIRKKFGEKSKSYSIFTKMSRFCSEHWFSSPCMAKCWKMEKSGSYICSRVQKCILQGFCTLGMSTKSPRFRLLTHTTNIHTRFCVFSAFGHIWTWKQVLGGKPARFRKNAVTFSFFDRFWWFLCQNPVRAPREVP